MINRRSLVLLVGGCGFIGSHLTDRLLSDGFRVRILDRAPEQFRAPLKAVGYQFGSFEDPNVLEQALNGVSAVIHLASTSFPASSNEDPVIDLQTNLLGSVRLIDMSAARGIRRFVFLSSGGAVYGTPNSIPIAENHVLRPQSAYGIVKASVEQYLDLYARMHHLSTVAIRPSNPYGPRQGHLGVQGVINTILHNIRNNQPIEIWGDGSVVRDYIHVIDLVEFCVRALTSEKRGVYNAGSGIGTSLRDLLMIIRQATRVQVNVLFREGRIVDAPVNILDTRLAERDFEWKAQIPLSQGITQLWNFMNK